MTRMRHHLLVLASLSCVLANVSRAEAQAQSPATPEPSTIRVTGQATVEAQPDQVEVDAGVVTRAETSQRASAENARLLDAALTSLRRSFPMATIRSVAYSVRPEYNQPTGNAEPRITGYTATNLVRVTLTDVSRVGALIDAATTAGANRVERVQYSLGKEDTVRAQALREAAVAARTHADALATALGVRIVRILSASEESVAPVRQFAEMATFARAGAAPTTPISVGPIEMTATVILTVEVAPTP